MEKILVLEKRGCNYADLKDVEKMKISDVRNYRVGIYDYSIRGKDGRNYILEFGGYEKKKVVETKTGKKKIVTDYINALHIDTQYEDEKGCWRNLELEKRLQEMRFTYNLEDILKCVNEISKDTYTSVIFV